MFRRVKARQQRHVPPGDHAHAEPLHDPCSRSRNERSKGCSVEPVSRHQKEVGKHKADKPCRHRRHCRPWPVVQRQHQFSRAKECPHNQYGAQDGKRPPALLELGADGDLDDMQRDTTKYRRNQANPKSRGPNKGCNIQPIQALTNEKAPVLRTIRNMKADGYTHVAEGVGWGLRVLSPGEPFTEGRPYDDETRKAILLLTDGENTFKSRSTTTSRPTLPMAISIRSGLDPATTGPPSSSRTRFCRKPVKT